MTILETLPWFLVPCLIILIWRPGAAPPTFLSNRRRRKFWIQWSRENCLLLVEQRITINWLLCTLHWYKIIYFLFQRHRWPPNIWVHLLVLGFADHLISGVSGQCFGGVETYEKTSGTTVLCDAGCTSQGLLSQPDTAVTRDCIAICKQTSSCSSFTVGESRTSSTFGV